MSYETIYAIASSPPQAIIQILTDAFTQKPVAFILLGTPIVAALLSWLKKNRTRDIIIMAFGGAVVWPLFITIFSLAFGYREHMQLAQAYLNNKCEKIEGSISGLRQGVNPGRNYFEAANFTVNGKTIDFSSNNPGFNKPFDKHIRNGEKVRIWLTGNSHFRQVIVRLDVEAGHCF